MSGKEYTVFYLKYAKADAAAALLHDILSGGTGGGGGGGGGGSLLGDIATGMLGDVGGGLLGGLLGGAAEVVVAACVGFEKCQHCARCSSQRADRPCVVRRSGYG